MEREILYRGKATNRDIGYHRTRYKNGDWVYGLVTRLYDEHFENLPAEMTNTAGVSGIEVDYKTIGQYTGLTDKNGVKIFEGDVVSTQYGRLCVVIWHQTDCHCGWDLYPVNDEHKPPSKWCAFNSDCLEVVANLHDNPEMLKG